jgi:kynurenine formamidase
MLVDLTMNTPPLEEIARLLPTDMPVSQDHLKKLLESGHIGTHFDVMDKEFPFESFRTNGKIFDISKIKDREVEIDDLNGQAVEEGDTVLFYTGIFGEKGYLSKEYSFGSANLSDALVTYLIERKIRIIGIDANGAQKPQKHVAVDQRCADAGVFIIENLHNLEAVLQHSPKPFVVYTAPWKRRDLTGLPCRVVAELAD